MRNVQMRLAVSGLINMSANPHGIRYNEDIFSSNARLNVTKLKSEFGVL